MARISEQELIQLKQEISLARLAEACGIVLKLHGKGYRGHIWSASYCKINFRITKKYCSHISGLDMKLSTLLALMESAHTHLIKSTASIGPKTPAGS